MSESKGNYPLFNFKVLKCSVFRMPSVVTACRTIAHAHCYDWAHRHWRSAYRVTTFKIILLELQVTGTSTVSLEKIFINARPNAKNNS